MIGITYTETSFEPYLKWLEYFGTDYIVLNHNERNAFEKFGKCDGLILTGGVDIYPELYNDWENKEDTGKFNPERDGFELKLFASACDKNIPVLGICRGCQLINVYFNGSLIYDLETIRKVNHRKIDDKTMRLHKVNINPGSKLHEILGKSEGTVTSSHHQAIDRPGEGIKVTSKAPDGIVEGIEYDGKNIIGVQWHPERFDDFKNEFSGNLLVNFFKTGK
ncbi:MAG: gamma-glutamyl-gamma-aminobutyrate hydrolase family protein [Bacteroidetes bacterium]|nr:gamma-glutamyl-gamma-aminobutyrate hydrolase family protein [Bacteroidota bacterium]